MTVLSALKASVIDSQAFFSFMNIKRLKSYWKRRACETLNNFEASFCEKKKTFFCEETEEENNQSIYENNIKEKKMKINIYLRNVVS